MSPSQSSVRPMYPPPPSIYYPQASQQSTQFIAQASNQPFQSSFAPTSTLPPAYSSPQYVHSLNPPVPAHPNQTPPFPQPMPYGIYSSATGSANQQNNNNFNGPLSVSKNT